MTRQDEGAATGQRWSKLPMFRRESMLTQLREYKEVQVVYCFLIALVFISIACDLISYTFDKDALAKDMAYASHITKGWEQGLCAYFLCLAINFGMVFPLTVHWIRSKFVNENLYKLSAFGCIVLLVLAPLKLMLSLEIGVIMKFSFLMEHVRIFLKSVTFVVETVRKSHKYRRLISTKDKEGNEDYNDNGKTPEGEDAAIDAEVGDMLSAPTFGRYLYFSYAPVYVYQDSFEKNKCRDWKQISTLTGECLCMIYILFHMQKKTALYFNSVGKEPFVVSEFCTMVYWAGLHGLWIFYCIGYGMIHLWMNLTAEILKFTNRNFYHDWWMAVDIQQNQQRWNRIVQAWLYENIYKVVRTSGGSRNLSAISVLIVSGLIHEYVIGFTTGLFLPIMSSFQLLFFPLHLILKGKQRPDHIFPVVNCITYHFGVLFFWTLAITGYSLEFYSRQNCRVAEGIVETSWRDFFTPRFVTCISFV